ncbi:MAG: radical SAM protein [Spirochaetales bacterium]|nr:radical SAM protein [Spirochaetales bacterium]
MKKEKKTYKYVFGPVPSRRLGFSLGIDVVPFKTCSYDCIYCQLGKTNAKTTERKEFVPLKQIFSELKLKLKQNIRIDYLTLSGSGEPTLYSRLDELIFEIKRLTDKPLAVLTNGSLLWQHEVCKGVRNADLVIPSLDAGNENMFQYVNRPCKDLEFEKVVHGLIAFSAKFTGKIWLEVFLLNGVTAIRSEVVRINSLIQKIKPHKIQLNTVKRPPAESFAFAVPQNLLRDMAHYFDGNVEIIADFSRTGDKKYFQATKHEIINLLKRRPCSLDDISGGLNLHPNEVLKYVEQLLQNGKIIMYDHNNTHFYTVR